MAKKVIDSMYTFNPATRTVVITNRYVKQESLLLITNVTTGTVIFNFSDPDLKATSYVGDAQNYAMNPNISNGSKQQETQSTTIVLSYNTVTMSSTDKLMITIDEQSETFTPSDVFTDPVQKLRVSEPQSLMDTDFEYSVQPSKWESLSLVQNYPSFFAKGTGGNSFVVTAISGNGSGPRSLITVTVSTAHLLITGDIVSVQETTNQLAEGTFAITVTNATNFTYISRGVVSGSVFDVNATSIYGGGLYSAAPIAVSSITSAGGTNSLVTVNTTNRHGLFPGAPIDMTGATATPNLNGNWIITNVTSPTQFQFQLAATQGAGTLSLTGLRLTVSPEGYVQHRSLDGGVSITPGGNSIGVQQIRQTRRYFRYQSGKGMQFSTGLKMTPTFDIQVITSSGSTVTVTVLQDHNLQIGAVLLIENVEINTGTVNFYNGRGVRGGSTYVVTSVLSTKAFTYQASGTSSDTTPGGDSGQITCHSWDGATIRSGLFDSQNGFFFEYDGKQLFACRRQSVREQYGSITATLNSGTITGLNTRFREQLIAGDQIVIKGQTYEIQGISSDTTLFINPTYQGPTLGNIRYLKIQTYKIPQSEWNQDRLDGTGPSGYNLDIAKMQMSYLDYTWYGAGHIRFGFRGVNGEIVYCHRMPNNNTNTSAYMRSGNLPARFETATWGYFSKLVGGANGVAGSALSSTDTTMYVKDAQHWPSSGFVLVQDGTGSEMVRYTGKTAYNSTARGWGLTGLTRRTTYSFAALNAAGVWSASAYSLGGSTASVTFTPDVGSGGVGATQVGVSYVYNNCAPIVSHWGVSVIMDGRYDDDKSYIFTAGMNRYLTVASGATARPLIAIRIAPSVDSGNGRNFGIREVINRMQLTLAQLGIISQGQFLIEGILNPIGMTFTGISLPNTWQNVPVGSGSLAQVIYFDNTQNYATSNIASTGTVTGGDKVFGFYTENGGGTSFSTTTYDLDKVRDLGTSILSGNGSSTNPGFPTGPDCLVITARNIANSGSAALACRIGWTEAQA
jgi:hypothetical protein